MKKLLLLIAAVASLASCVQNIEGVDTSLGYTTITVGMPESRTSLGAKDDNGIYAIYWSEGDQIVVNGAASTRMEIGENKKSATFHFEGSLLVPPYNLTYPYTANSACAEGKPTVVFVANQEYVANSFGVGDAPMCGYIESGEASMMHLAGVLQFKVKGTNKLSKIEIIAEEGKALAGEFDVDCKSGTLTAINGEVSNKITYTANQVLTADGVVFHITVPKGIEGVCKVVLTDSAGQKMNLKWTASNVAAGIVREFKEFSFKGGASFELEEMSSITDDLEVEERKEPTSGVWGYIKYNDGTPAVGVSVSDGFKVVTTDALGMYHFAKGVNERTYYIYYSIPATAKVVVNDDGYHTFFKRYSNGIARYDFTLEKIEKESAFSLFAIADTHGCRDYVIERLKKECVAGIKTEKQNRGTTPCYAVILGDIVCTTSTNSANDQTYNPLQPGYMDDMRNLFVSSNTGGVPVFYVMGNHDYDRAYFDAPTYSDYDKFNLHAQDCYEEKFGPANYSFNRGDTHIVCMRDIVWPESSLTGKTSADSKVGYTDAQIEWLRQDLANVPKSNKVILCVHIPQYLYYKNDATYPTVKTVVDMIAEYNEPQILSGHSHGNCDIKANSTNFAEKSGNLPVSEKVVTGNWNTGAGTYKMRCSEDGSPFGFDVYDVNGANFTDHYYVDCTSDVDYVMRAHLSCDTYGGDSDGDGVVHVASSFGSAAKYFSFTRYKNYTYLYVNVFNGTPDTWTLVLYVNGEEIGPLTWNLGDENSSWGKTVDAWAGDGTGTADDPWRPKYVANHLDWWYISYLVNEAKQSFGANALSKNVYHRWIANLTTTGTGTKLTAEQLEHLKNGNFEIVATHTEFGKTRTYRTSKIFGQNDYNGYVNYK